MPAPQATRWCGTAWTEDPPTPQDASKVRYHCGALENCPTTGKEHYQIYFELFKKTTLTGALALFGLTGSELHLDICRGSGFDNRQYIKGPYDKDGKQKPANDTFYEHGTMSKGAGHRTDLDEVQKALDDGATFEEVSAPRRGRYDVLLPLTSFRARRTYHWRAFACHLCRTVL
uniref:Replication-associated protein n=1 Tax=Cressdnaviricota sp. TaxID=2748378 RepID=A0A890UZC1_9VIRU|nr:MAG: replication-associated protein [Cressdnaviricota sp.]